MITANRRINQVGDAALRADPDWPEALDARDRGRFADVPSDDVSITSGNAPALTGKAQVTGMLAGLPVDQARPNQPPRDRSALSGRGAEPPRAP